MKGRLLRLALPAGLALVALTVLGVVLFAPGSASAAPATPSTVAVYLKNFLPEYDRATMDFLEAQFANPAAPANGLVTYTIVANLSAQSLAGAKALIIDESSDMSLTAAEATAIHTYVAGGGKVGLFANTRLYWTSASDAPNPSSYQGIKDLFGNASVGNPVAAEVTSGFSSARVASSLINSPYVVAGATMTRTDSSPFTPITSVGTLAALVSPATSLPVAVVDRNGIFMTNSIGDGVQPGDSQGSYGQFITDAIVWLANGAPMSNVRLPVIFR